MAKLVFNIQDGKDMEYLLTTAETTLGRREENDIVINNTWISSRHAMIRLGDDGIYEVKDLGSSNGTFVNGVRVEQEKLRDGDVVSFGQLETSFFEDQRRTLPKAAVAMVSKVSKSEVPSNTANGAGKSDPMSVESSKRASAKSVRAAENVAGRASTSGPEASVATLASPKRDGVGAVSLERLVSSTEAPVNQVVHAEAQFKALQEQLGDLRKQMESAQKSEEVRRVQAETSLKSKLEELATMEAAVRELKQVKAEIESSKGTLEDLRIQSTASRKELLEATQQTAALRAESAVLGSKNFQFVQAQSAHAKQEQAMADTKAAFHKELAAHEALMATNQQEIAEARQSLALLHEKIQSEEVRHLEASQHSASQLETLQALHEQSNRHANARLELEETEKALAETRRRVEAEENQQREQLNKSAEDLRVLNAELAEAQAVRTALREAQAELTAVRQALANESEHLEKSRMTAGDEIRSWEAQVGSLQQVHIKLHGEHEHMLSSMEAEQLKAREALQTLQKEHRALESVTQRLTEAQAQFAALQQEKQSHLADLETISSARSEMEKELLAVTARHTESQEKFSGVQKNLNDCSAAYERLSAEHHQTVQSLAAAEAQHQQVRENLALAEEELASRNQALVLSSVKLQELAQTEAALKHLQADLHSAQATLDQEQLKVGALEQTKIKVESDLADLQAEFDRLNALKQELQVVEPILAEKSKELADVEKSLFASRMAYEQLGREHIAMQQDSAEEAAKLSELQRQLSEFERQSKRVQLEIQEAESALQAKSLAAVQAQTTLDRHQRDLQTNLQAGELQLQTRQGEIEKLNFQRDDLQQQIGILTQDLQARAAELDQLQRNLSVARTDFAEQQAVLQAAQSEQQNNGKALEELKDELRMVSQTVAGFRKQQTAIEQELRAAQEKLALEQKSLEQRRRESMEMEIRLQQQTTAQQQTAAKIATEAKILGELEGRRVTLQTETVDLETRLSKLQISSKESGSAAEASSARLSEITAAIGHVENDLASLQESHVTVAAELQVLESNRKRMELELQAQQSKRQEFEDLARRALEYQTLLAQGPPPLTPGKVARLEEQIKVLEERKQTIASAVDTNWGTVHAIGKNLIKQIDFQDDLIAQLENNQSSPEALSQLKVLREGILDMLQEFGITPYSYSPGTEVDIAMRRRIQIVESRTSEALKTKILDTFRPGYVCTPAPDQPATLLRKAEVSVSTPK